MPADVGEVVEAASEDGSVCCDRHPGEGASKVAKRQHHYRYHGQTVRMPLNGECDVLCDRDVVLPR